MILLTRRAQHTRLTGGMGTARADVGVSSDGSDSDSNSDIELSDSDSNSDSELSDSGTRLPNWSVKSSVGN